MRDGPFDRWLDVTDWSAEITWSVTDVREVKSSTDPDKVVGTHHTSWQAVASGRLGGPRFSWGGDGVLSASWDEESNIDESNGDGRIQLSRATASGWGTGTGTISLEMATQNGKGIYIIREWGLGLDVTTTTWSYEQDAPPVISISEFFNVSTGGREVIIPRLEKVLPRSGLVLKGNKQVPREYGIANVSWTFRPLKTAGSCKLTGISPTTVTLFTGVAQKFTAKGKGLAGVEWRAPGASPAASPAPGPTFTTTWWTHGEKTLTATCAGVTKTAKIIVLDVSIDINRRPKDRAPPSVKEDIVQLKSNHPPRRFTVPCRIKLLGPATRRQTVVLTDPTFRLRFPGPMDTDRTLVLPKDGTFKAFEITGEQRSVAKGDAKIQTRSNIATRPIVAEKDVTVFSFDEAEMRLKKGGKYVLKVNEGYRPFSPGASVTFSSKARLKPAGLDCKAPQIKNLRVGIMQDMSIPDYLVTTIWDKPTIKWKASVKKNATLKVSKSVRLEERVEGPGSGQYLKLTLIASAAPLWDDAAAALKPPGGCPNADEATSVHTEAVLPDRPFWDYTKGRVTWNNLVKATIISHYRTFCVVFDKKTKHFSALRQADWELNVTSSGPPADQQADVFPDGNVASDPAPKPEGGVRYSHTWFDYGTATKTFKKDE
jgi:hypothetical protein